ncbi:hypothetical protein [Roseivirga seohaensis]|uniref:hypothetical protein n=1 Tax=Roseivirga seohaensis TaxID=1914963 RepID=UPI003BA9EE93
MKAKLTIFFFLTGFLLTGCKKYDISQIEGKWRVIIDEEIYYERWISGNSMIWYNSEFGIQLWKFDFDGNVLSYSEYDREEGLLLDSNLEETITSLTNKNIIIDVSTKPSGISYSLKRISTDKFNPDFSTLDLHEVYEEIKSRQYEFYNIK